MRQAEILQGQVSRHDFKGINACREAAWVEGHGLFRRDLYPYHAFSQYESWRPEGELGQAIAKGDLYVSVVRDEQQEIVAHGALVRNKFGWEAGRFFARTVGHKDGIAAAEGVRQQAEALGVDRVHVGVSYNRTAMWRALEESFLVHGWKLAVLGLMPDIYNEHGLRWGETIAMVVKDRELQLPQLGEHMPQQIQDFAKGMQELNQDVVRFDARSQQKPEQLASPYAFADNVIGLDWHDNSNQQAYLNNGFKPVGIVKLHDAWTVVMHKGDLPPLFEGRRSQLGKGRSPIAYPPVLAGVPIKDIMQHVYQQ